MSEAGANPVPRAMLSVFDRVCALTDKFCGEHLNDEYAELCRHIAAALSRRRPSPLLRGGLDAWACGIAYAAGRHNFLFDRETELYLSSAELAKAFGVSNSTAAARAKTVRESLRIRDLDPNWTLPSLLEANPLAWFIQVNGLIVDAREMPRAIQEEAFRLGLIPYLPE